MSSWERLSQKVLHSPPGSRLIPDTRKSTALLLRCFIAAERPWIFFLFFFSVCLSFFLFQNLVNGFFSLSLYVKVSCRGFDVRFSSILFPSLFLTVPLSLPLFLSFSFPLSLPLPSSLSRSPALPETCASVLLPSFLPSCLPSRSNSRVVFYASGRHRLSPVPMQRTTNSSASAARHPLLGLHRYCYPRGRLRSAAPPVLRLFPPTTVQRLGPRGLLIVLMYLIISAWGPRFRRRRSAISYRNLVLSTCYR